jgi:hypothetical protein
MKHLPIGLVKLKIISEEYSVINIYQACSLHNLPHTLKHLYILGNNMCVNTLDASCISLPPSLVTLKIGKVTGLLYRIPLSLKKLHFDGNINSKIDLSDSNIEELYLGELFDSPLIKKLPITIKKIIFHSRCKYKKTLNNLPDSLEELWLGKSFNSEIKRWPKNLIKLVIQSYSIFSKPLFKNSKKIPTNLTHLIIESTNCKSLLTDTPQTLKVLSLPQNYDIDLLYFPSQLEELKLIYTYNYIRFFHNNTKKIYLPDSIKVLDYDYRVDGELVMYTESNPSKISLPSNLKLLILHHQQLGNYAIKNIMELAKFNNILVEVQT